MSNMALQGLLGHLAVEVGYLEQPPASHKTLVVVAHSCPHTPSDQIGIGNWDP